MKQLHFFPSSELEQDTYYITIVQKLAVQDKSTDKDLVRLKNLLETARKELPEDMDKSVKKALTEQLDEIYKHRNQLVEHVGGLVLYVTPEEIYYYVVGLEPESGVYQGDKPHVKPLIEDYQFIPNYDILVLNQADIQLFHGDAAGIHEIILPEGAPVKVTDVLDGERTGGQLNVIGSTPGGSLNYHGHHETSESKHIDRVNYFQAVDRYISEHYSKPHRAPLVLYALPENIAVFKELSKNSYLSDKTIEYSGAQVSLEEIEKHVLEAYQLAVEDEILKLLKTYEETSPEYLLINEPHDLALAASEGRIESLIVQKGYEEEGSITEDGRYDRLGSGNFVDELLQRVLASKGKIYILEQNKLPETYQLVAKLRY